MKVRGFLRKWGAVLGALVLLAGPVGELTREQVYAESGRVYTCAIGRYYRHPVTGEIEDSGGEEHFEIGQGMVEGSVGDLGLVEETAGGSTYLTIHMQLMDFTEGHAFWVQNRGEKGWAEASAWITGTGSDSNGATADICLEVPSSDCVVRGTMMVTAMGRSVIWYMAPYDLREGNETSMAASNVGEGQEETVLQEGESSGESEGTGPGQEESSGLPLSGGQTGESSGQTGILSGPAAEGSGGIKPPAPASGKKEPEQKVSAALPAPDASGTGGREANVFQGGKKSARGLSLSTAGQPAPDGRGEAGQTGEKSRPMSLGKVIVLNILSLVAAGIILSAIFFAVIWVCRKHIRH